MKSYRKLVNYLIDNKESISTMESCTGGAIANAITSIEGASDILKFSAVTYSNEFKIKMGVDSNVIDEYSVYSRETAHEMAYNISNFTGSSIGIGITGKLNKADKNNNFGDDNIVYICIYYNNKYYDTNVKVYCKTRKENKDLVGNKVLEELYKIFNIK